MRGEHGPIFSRREAAAAALAVFASPAFADPLALSGAKPATPAAALPRSGGITFTPADAARQPYPRIIISKNGAVLDGVDCSGCYVTIMARDVTLRGCRFTAAKGVYCPVDGYDEATNITIESCHFDGLKLDVESFPMLRVRKGTVFARDCLFENLPSDAVTMVGGVVERCVFRTAGYLPEAHADAIWIPNSVAPIVIRDNLIDFRKPPDAKVIPNTAVQIIAEFGDVHDVLVERNICRGGSYTIQASGHPMIRKGLKMTSIVVRDNLLSDWLYGPLYPMYKPPDLKFENNRHYLTGELLSGALRSP